MQINIKTSEANRSIVADLTHKLNLGTENITARIAFAYSLSRNTKLKLIDIQDSKGKEYKDDILFGRYRDFYIALICQYYNLYKTDKDIGKYIKMHVDHGLELINRFFENNKNYSGFDFLLENIEMGIDSLEALEVSLDHVINKHQSIIKDYFAEEIKILVGKDFSVNEPIYVSLNNNTVYNNCHIAAAGNSGTGKTQFALELLNQIVDNSNHIVNFIYLDFKGLKNEDIKQYQPFFKKTKAIFVDAPHKPFPVNPLAFIDVVNETNRKMGISKFVDIIAKYSGIGKNQEQTLKDATREAFAKKKGGQYPSLRDIYDEVIEIVGEKASTLKEILFSLSDYTIFESDVDPANSFLTENYYLSLSGDLPDAVRFTSIFLIINYIYNTFMNMDNTPVNGKYKGLRYVLLIDEAHVLFKDKKSQDLLEKVLREIRSKGVAVVLLSQGIEEFNQPNFDFSSMCEIAFLLDIKDKTNVNMINRFLGFGERESIKVARSMERIQKGQAISNIKEFKKAELFEISQFVKR